MSTKKRPSVLARIDRSSGKVQRRACNRGSSDREGQTCRRVYVCAYARVISVASARNAIRYIVCTDTHTGAEGSPRVGIVLKYAVLPTRAELRAFFCSPCTLKITYYTCSILDYILKWTSANLLKLIYLVLTATTISARASVTTFR